MSLKNRLTSSPFPLIMRKILVEYARRRKAASRGGSTITLDDNINLLETRSVDLVVLGQCLEGVGRARLSQSRIVELRFFRGLSIEETSTVLRISPITLKRDWTTAEMWLDHEISRTA